MSYLNFDKSELINLEYSLGREMLRSNRAGSYASTTVIACNTRKYHGLLVCPMEHLDGDRHVLLSTLDCSITQGNSEFNLGIHKYQGDLYSDVIYSQVGQAHKSLNKNTAESIPYLEESVRLNPNDPQTLYNLAGAYSLDKKFMKALETINACLRINPKYPSAVSLKTQLLNIIRKTNK